MEIVVSTAFARSSASTSNVSATARGAQTACISKGEDLQLYPTIQGTMSTTLRKHEICLPEPFHPLSTFEKETLQTVTSNEVTELDHISNTKAYFNHDIYNP
jgi:hypothetical protein